MTDETATMAVDKVIDASGSFCPGPLMELMRAVRSAPVGSTLAVISTDPGSNKDIPIWIAKARHEYLGSTTEGRATRFVMRTSH
jgi:TusA-related sulfurtransferase